MANSSTAAHKTKTSCCRYHYSCNYTAILCTCNLSLHLRIWQQSHKPILCFRGRYPVSKGDILFWYSSVQGTTYFKTVCLARQNQEDKLFCDIGHTLKSSTLKSSSTSFSESTCTYRIF